MSTDFGDFDPDDALDHEAADPEQVARKLHIIRRREALEDADWEDLDPGERLAFVAIMASLLSWLRRQGAHP